MGDYFEKDFDGWNRRKKKLHASARQITFSEREIWWCSLGLNIGSEQDGANELYERPVLVLRKFSQDVLWVLPLTHTQKEGPYYFSVEVNERSSTLVLSQIKLISSRRLQPYIEKLPAERFREVIEAVKGLFPIL